MLNKAAWYAHTTTLRCCFQNFVKKFSPKKREQELNVHFNSSLKNWYGTYILLLFKATDLQKQIDYTIKL